MTKRTTGCSKGQSGQELSAGHRDAMLDIHAQGEEHAFAVGSSVYLYRDKVWHADTRDGAPRFDIDGIPVGIGGCKRSVFAVGSSGSLKVVAELQLD